jgi:hypothetical protein
MMPENNDKNYKDFFNSTEEGTPVPGFEEVMQFSPRQKKKPSSLLLIVPVVIFLGVIVYGIYFFQDKSGKAGFSQTDTKLFEQKPLVWEWKSPTVHLLQISPGSGSMNYELPTDFLSSPTISLQRSDSKKTN